ncbi:MAG: MmcQ/YjbR family DNA-binding protein [Actinobacteria bacterium]|nr:MmcQ/YjbR family DNA-binding protein [Actinomycetota bacterium]
MFRDDDPALARLRELALALPGAEVKVSHGRPAFFTTKVFAYYGGSLKANDGWVEHASCVLVLLEPDEREALLLEDRTFVPAYLGPSGWLGIDLPELDDVDGWTEVAELLDASFRRTAPGRLVARL